MFWNSGNEAIRWGYESKLYFEDESQVKPFLDVFTCEGCVKVTIYIYIGNELINSYSYNIEQEVETMKKETIDFLSQYIVVDNETVKAIKGHLLKYNLNEEDIITYYPNMKDLFFNFEQMGYTEEETKKIIYNGKGEFKVLPNKKGIIRILI